MARATSHEYENVNGFKLQMKMEESGSPKSITFTISYKNNKINCSWSKLFMIFTLILYAGSFIYTKITLNSMFGSAIVIMVLHIFWATHSVKSEKLTVVPTVGLQSTIQYVVGKMEKFVPWPTIDDVVINEVIQMNRVLYYLTVVVKTGQHGDCESFNIVPLFKYTKPRLQLIEAIYYEIHQVIKDHQDCNENKKEENDQTIMKGLDHGDAVNKDTESDEIHGDIG